MNDFAVTGLPGVFNSLHSLIALILGLPRLLVGGVVEAVSSPLFDDDDLGFGQFLVLQHSIERICIFLFDSQ